MMLSGSLLQTICDKFDNTEQSKTLKEDIRSIGVNPKRNGVIVGSSELYCILV